MGGTYSRAKYDKTKFWQKYFDSAIPRDAAKGKTVAVTGATANGLGIWLAKHAALLGARKVILLNRASPRNAPAVEEVRQFAREVGSVAIVETVECDLLSFESVRKSALALKRLCDDGCLDVLCLNAGTMAAPDEITVDGFNRECQVNVLSQALLLKETFGLLERAVETRGEARIVQHSSGARGIPKRGELVEDYFRKVTVLDGASSLPASLRGDREGGMFSMGPAWHRYGQTKLANSMLTQAFTEKLSAKKKNGVKAVVASPGLAASELQVTTNQHFKTMKAWEANFVFMLAGQSARDGSLPLTHACFHPSVQSGDFYEPKRFTAYGPPVAIAVAGTFKNPKSEKASISDPDTRAMMWRALADACGGEIF
jgi:NAD(P)-dependent dehydrogenase (short-subunit alcohol dehydrogenase family)